MSNTLNTPIEALEREYPLRIERYALRPGSGGAGRHRGGDGVIRAMRVLEDCRLSLLTERRRHAPRGAAGGGDGALGENRLNGRQIGGKLSRDLRAGDLLEIRTPGGGGYGPPQA
jgi:N-methylhydantoinase B